MGFPQQSHMKQTTSCWDSSEWCNSNVKSYFILIIVIYHCSGGDVILESPVLPVMEGSDVTLHCWYTKPSKLLNHPLTVHVISIKMDHSSALSLQDRWPSTVFPSLMKDSTSVTSLTLESHQRAGWRWQVRLLYHKHLIWGVIKYREVVLIGQLLYNPKGGQNSWPANANDR